MDITSTPFIRNDYWPDYNELNELNGRIDEVENELSLTNINLTDKIENVEGNLNAYISQQNNTVVTNNVVVNNINANYATGDFLNFNNVNLDNVYVENLTVNKPVFDITLNTPHIENVTSLGGNIFNANIIDCEINTDNIFVNNLNVAQGTAETFKVTGDLIVNKNIEPISSSAVLGYDATGKVIPVRATYDVSFPEDANYLYTDHFGTAYAGTAETEVTASDNLITANAVYNEALNIGGNIDNLRNDMNNELNIVNDNFANIDNNFANIDNNFNDVNNFVNDGFNNVANNFNDVANNFNDVANNFNDVANELNDAYNTINKLQDKIQILSVDDADYYYSGAPVNYQNVTLIKFKTKGAGTSISGIGPRPTNIAFNSTSNVLEFSCGKFNILGRRTRPASLTQIFNRDISYLFANCKKLNYSANIQNNEFNFNFCEPTGNFITNMAYTFFACETFNQNIQVPNSVTDMSSTFQGCLNFNQNIQIPDNVIDMSSTFCGSFDFNQNIQVPNGVTNLYQAFGGLYTYEDPVSGDEIDLGCPNFNQNVQIPNSVIDMRQCFMWDNSLNQNIQIPNSVTKLQGCFDNCWNLNQNILLPNHVTSLAYCFQNCNNLNQNILIPNSVNAIDGIFENCNNLNQPNMYIFSQNIDDMMRAFKGCHINNIHIPTSVPKDTSNYMYNCLVNGNTGITFPAANIFNDLPVDIEQWPPEA